MKKINSYLLLVLLPLVGCQTVVDIDIPLNERKIVINAVADPDNPWAVSIAYSKHVLDNGQNVILPPAGTVRVIDVETGQLSEQLTSAQGSSFYTGTQKPEPGKTYRLEADIPGHTRTEATGNVPLSVPIDNVEVDSVNSDGNGNFVRMRISFTDPSAIKNFYSIKLTFEGYYIVNMKDTVRFDNPVYIESDAGGLASDYDMGGELLSDDVFFNGKQHTITIRVRGYGRYYYPNDPFYRPAVRLILSNMEESLYRYKTTFNLQQSTEGDPFAQPVLVFSNIQNGLGIFGGVSQSVREFK